MHTRTTGRRSRIPGLLLAGVLALAGCAESPPVVQLPSVTLAR